MKIDVADTGPGIPRQSLKKVFEDFYRVDNDLSRSIRGTGIGLALVKKFVAAMGGTVAASSNNGPGCTISIALPL
jgi:signal transduction histidine kinase